MLALDFLQTLAICTCVNVKVIYHIKGVARILEKGGKLVSV